MSKAKFLFLK